MGTTFDAVGRHDRLPDGEPSWRDDPAVRELMQVDGTSVALREDSLSTLVLIAGQPTAVPMDRWDAIDAGYVVLDGEPDHVVPAGREDVATLERMTTYEPVRVAVALPEPVVVAGPEPELVEAAIPEFEAIVPVEEAPTAALRTEEAVAFELEDVPAAEPEVVIPVIDDGEDGRGAGREASALAWRLPTPAPLSRSRADVSDWLRAVSRSAHAVPAAAEAPVAAPHVAGSAVAPGPVLIEARGVSKRYPRASGAVDALVDVDLEIRQGDFVVLHGPSGSGKSTLLYCLSGLEDVDSGAIVVAGEAMHHLSDGEKTALRARTMGFIFQTYHLVEHMTAIENVEMPLLLNGWDAAEARASATAALESVGLAARGDHRPGELSGGEQQRVTVARALVGDPQIVWADEPTGNLDDATAALVMGLLRSRNADGLTVVLVTHDAALVADASHRVTLAAGRVVVDPAASAA